MDTFSHALWGYGLFGQKGRPWLALFFGGLPDLASFGVLLGVRFVTGTLIRERPAIHGIPEWTILNYNIGHSLLIAGLCVALMLLWRRDIAFAMLAWPFHITLDFPFHSREFFPTQLFWPVSDWTFDGVSWGTAWVWFPNIAGLLVLLGYRFRQWWKRRKTAAKHMEIANS